LTLTFSACSLWRLSSIAQEAFERLTSKARHVDAPTPVELANAKHPRRRNVVEDCDHLQGARFPDRHALGVTRRNMDL